MTEKYVNTIKELLFENVCWYRGDKGTVLLSPNFIYNDFGRTTDTKIGSRTLSSKVYDNAKGLLDYTTYGNGTLVDYSYDSLGRQTDTIINGSLRYNKIYDGSSRILQIEDILLGKKIKYG